MATLIEYLPLILFFAVYKLVDIYWATGVLIGASFVQLGWHYYRNGHIATRHWVFFVIALVLGTMTILLRDEQFIKWKASIFYATCAIALLLSRYVWQKNLIEKAFVSLLGNSEQKTDNATPLAVPAALWDKLNLMWAVLCAAIAVVNLYVAYYFSLDFWVNFKVFGLMAVLFVAIFITVISLFKYLPEDES